MSEANVSETGDAPAPVIVDSSEKEVEKETEIKPVSTEAPIETKTEVTNINQSETTDKPADKPTDKPAEYSTENGDWQQRESKLLQKIEELQQVKNDTKEEGLQLQLKMREQEVDLLKSRVKNLETELQAALSKPGSKNQDMINNIKQQHEELLAKARGMIFDKTKMVKNQELQITALGSQVQSLKDINQITKDLLEIRNNEVKAMDERYQAMEARMKGEKEKYTLLIQRANNNSNMNDDVMKEYQTQMAIFKELKEKYEQRVQALVAENERLKQAILQNTTPAS